MYGTRNYGIAAFLVLTVSVGISVYLLHSTGAGENAGPASTEADVVRHRSYSSDPLLYAITSSSTYQQKYADPVLGGIVSHHLLANIDISNFFAEFTDQTISRVVIIGPNHYYPNDSAFLSTTRNYTTPFGNVDVDEDTITHLIKKGLVELSPHTLEEEHSISSLVPYVASYFPDAEIVPIIVSARATEEELQVLSDFLAQNDFSNTIVIASVDFSHHLYSNAAQIHDARSVAAIKSFDYDSLFELEVDSPGSLFVLLKYLESKSAKNISIQQQSSANIFNKYDSEDVTSYVFAHARNGEIARSAGVSALFFSDTMLGRDIARNNDLLSNIRGPEGNFLKGYDAVMVNLEGAIQREGCDAGDDELLIQPDDLLLLSDNYITHLGIMNNHFGRCPYDTQVKNIFSDKRLIPIDDSGRIITGTNIEAEIISFFASPVPPDISTMVNRVKEASGTGRIVVINMHWGVEYLTQPSAQEKELARALIDAGTDVIIGHHPHVVQPIETYKDGIIFYSLGNFISDQVGQETKKSFAVGLFGTDEALQATIFPYAQSDGVPTHLTQEEAGTFCTEIYRGDTSMQSSLHPCLLHIKSK